MENIDKILFNNEYTKSDNLYSKNKNNYISQIELIEKDDKYFQIIVTHLYKNQQKEKKNQIIKKTKILNFLENVIYKEPLYEYDSDDLFYNEFCNRCRTCRPSILITNDIYY